MDQHASGNKFSDAVAVDSDSNYLKDIDQNTLPN